MFKSIEEIKKLTTHRLLNVFRLAREEFRCGADAPVYDEDVLYEAYIKEYDVWAKSWHTYLGVLKTNLDSREHVETKGRKKEAKKVKKIKYEKHIDVSEILKGI